jgi:hypothetical protein
MSSDLCLNVLDMYGKPTCTMTFDDTNKNICVFEHNEETKVLFIEGLHEKIQEYFQEDDFDDVYHGTFHFFHDSKINFVVVNKDEDVCTFDVIICTEDLDTFFLPLMTCVDGLESCKIQDLHLLGLTKKFNNGISLLSLTALKLAERQGRLNDKHFLKKNNLKRVPASESSSEQGPAKRAKTSGD